MFGERKTTLESRRLGKEEQKKEVLASESNHRCSEGLRCGRDNSESLPLRSLGQFCNIGKGRICQLTKNNKDGGIKL